MNCTHASLNTSNFSVTYPSITDSAQTAKWQHTRQTVLLQVTNGAVTVQILLLLILEFYSVKKTEMNDMILKP